MDITLPAWTDRYLEELREHGLENRAAATARTTTRTVRKLRQECIEFDDACEAAIQEATDALEAEARRRALIGVEKGVYYQGSLVGYEQVYSDSLMQTFLKAKRPQQFGDKRELTGPGGGPLTIAIRTFGPSPNADASNPADAAPVIEAEYRQLPLDTLDIQDLETMDLV